MNPTEQEQVSGKKLGKLKKLAGKSLAVSSLIGTFTGGIGSYIYSGRLWQLVPAFFAASVIGCVAMPPTEEYCEETWNSTECHSFYDITPIFFLIALIDNANAIASARVKLKKLQQQGILPENIEAFKLTLLKLIDDRNEAAVSELVIATGYSATVIRSVLAILEKEEVVCVGNREDGTIIYRLI